MTWVHATGLQRGFMESVREVMEQEEGSWAGEEGTVLLKVGYLLHM